MSSIEPFATICGDAMSLTPFLQTRRMLQRRTSSDVSISYLVVLAVGFVLYFLYGLSISTRLVVTIDIVPIVATLITLAIAFRLRRRVVTA